MSKIAIIGSGIAGLVAARKFKRLNHHVTLFEKQASPGMGAAGFELQVGGHRVLGDLPSRMFNSQLWPNVARLYKELNVACEPVSATQTFFDRISGQSFSFALPVDWKTKLRSAAGLGTDTILNPLQRLQKQSAKDLASGTAKGSFAAYLSSHGFPDEFLQRFLFPALSATVCTCSDQAIGNYPAAILLDAMHKIASDEGLRRVSDGTSAVVNALLGQVDDLRCSTNVVSVVEDAQRVTVKLNNSQQQFDQVIVATQANHVARMCPLVSEDTKKLMASFQYEDVSVVVHSDTQLMPKNESDWRVFNFETSPTGSMCTVWLNKFHTQWPQVTPVFQTIKPQRDPSPESIVSSVRLQRPVVTEASNKLWASLEKINQRDSRIKFCGSYAVAGIPLLESAVVSAERLSL